ncbi:hypothetical protein SAMN05216285_3625 [Natrinema salifodinae]|uniref:Calcium-binding outer membrane-like protein n=2 Tax=Natrinema salifodinae TaxID=1202768 RepID=A0A1I0QI79_9EURY|nr:hypothetical protein SAMN05216285_3625 [Natrinema salifodinae]
MAKGALAAGALTLGTGAFGTATVGAQDDQVAVFANNFYPQASFDVLAQLETSTTVEILQVDGETVSEISQPDEWAGHIIRYDIGQESGITSFLFVRGQSLSTDDSGTIGEDASVLNSDLNLLSASIDSGTTGDTDTIEEDTDDDNGAIEEDTDDNGVLEEETENETENETTVETESE